MVVRSDTKGGIVLKYQIYGGNGGIFKGFYQEFIGHTLIKKIEINQKAEFELDCVLGPSSASLFLI